MSAAQEFSINVVSAAAVGQDEENDIRSSLENCTSKHIMRTLAENWKKENDGDAFSVETPDGKGVISENLRFKELDTLKDLISDSILVDDDQKLIIRLEDDSFSSNRASELYALLVFIGILVRGWESDSEFSWSSEKGGTTSYFWDGDGQIFPESDYSE